MCPLGLTQLNPVDLTDVQSSEYHRLLGYSKDHRLEGEEAILASWAPIWYQQSGQPFHYSRKIKLASHSIQGDQIHLSTGHVLTSKVLAERFSQNDVHEIIVFGVSAGEKLSLQAEQFWVDDKPDKAYFLDKYGSAVTERMTWSLCLRWSQEAQDQNMALLPHYCPGYSDWDLGDQKILLERLAENQVRPLELSLTESGMLHPNKSQLGIFGLTRCLKNVVSFQDYVPCQQCTLNDCDYRREPCQDYSITLQANLLGKRDEPPTTTSRPTYAFPEKALQRWSKELLTIEQNGDDPIRARFVYEGSTCNNMGEPFRFVYHVKLSSQIKGYHILEKFCHPLENDNHYQNMCAFRKNGEALLVKIKYHQPLLGQPLAETLNWEPDVLPAGCQCSQSFQDHKWKIVLQTLHYRLHQPQ